MVALETPSYQLTNHLPIEVRDSGLALVGELRHGKSMNLSPGWYEVSAVLDDGRSHSRLVEVRPEARSDVSLSFDRSRLMPTTVDGPTPRSMSQLVNVTGADLAEENPSSWLLVGQDDPTTMPVAVLALDDGKRSVSLPTNPRGHDPELRACVLSLETYVDGVEPRAWIHPKRLVSSAIQRMIAERQVFRAQSVVEHTADDLLMSKYQDPVGAALGALVMYRAGTLRNRLGWLKNLARDFDWLPDGKILLGALLLSEAEPANHKEATELLLAASKQRPLFTLSYSVLLDTLRRWPIELRRDDVDEALETMSTAATRVDWNAVTLTIREIEA